MVKFTSRDLKLLLTLTLLIAGLGGMYFLMNFLMEKRRADIMASKDDE